MVGLRISNIRQFIIKEQCLIYKLMKELLLLFKLIKLCFSRKVKNLTKVYKLYEVLLVLRNVSIDLEN